MATKTIQELITEFPLDTPEDILSKYQGQVAYKSKLMSSSVMRMTLSDPAVDLYDWFLGADVTGLRLVLKDEMATGGDFNFMIDHPLYLGGLFNTLRAQYSTDATITVQLDALKFACDDYCNEEISPYENATLAEVKKVFYPAVKELCVQPVTQGNEKYAVSASSKDLFTFVTVLTDNCTGIDVSIRWREDGTQPWKVFSSPIRLQGGYSGESLSQVIARPKGIKDARHFEFSFKGQYAGQVSTVNVTVSQ